MKRILISAFALMILLIVGLGALSIYTAARVGEIVQELSDTNIPCARSLAEIDRGINEAIDARMDLALNPTPEVEQRLRDLLISLKERTREHVEHESRLGSTYAEEAEEVSSHVDEFITAVSDQDGLPDAGPGTMGRTHRVIDTASDSLSANVRDNLADELADLAVSEGAASAYLGTHTSAALGLTIAATLLGLLIAVVSLVTYTRNRKELELATSASKAKTEFLANISHEIRTPMTAILGYSELLRQPEQTPEERREYVRVIRLSGEHLMTIINDLLDVSKIEAGRMEVESVPCSPAQIVDDVASVMRPRAAAKGLRLDVTYAGLVPETIHSDPTRLHQILMNLTSNAVKFTDHGRVDIGIALTDAGTPGGPKLRLTISDTGIGITPAQAAGLFKPFAQADGSTTRKFGGTGLGLAISKRLAQLLGGDITIASNPGKGCRFTVMVATGSLDGVRLIDGAAAAAVPATRTTAAELAATPTLGAPAAVATPATAATPTTPTPPPMPTLCGRILLAEDGPDNQRLISFHLRKAGAEVEIAENGRIAADRAMVAVSEGRPYSLILMDMQMPELDGYQATTLLRSQGYHHPIVALTAHAMPPDRDKCLHAGCDDYASKPIDRRALLELGEKWMTKAA